MRCLAFILAATTWLSNSNAEPLFSGKRHSCISEAAAHHGVNPSILSAIIHVESRGNPHAINHNTNQTVDVGRGQINSIHFAELAKYGIEPQHLFNACISDFVSAWLLRRAINRHGNTWFGIAAYHSTTPDKNHRYQQLVYNELQSQAAKARR